MSRVLTIARCAEHGLHGERTECFVCGGPVEQVPMVPASFEFGAVVTAVLAVERAARELTAMLDGEPGRWTLGDTIVEDDEAVNALLSLHDHLSDLTIARDAALSVRRAVT